MQKKSETLSQREKAQKELINLKKMQQGAMSTETLKQDKKIEPKTFSEKVAHFMHYNKYKVIVGVLAFAAVSFIVYNWVMVPKYDGKVTVYCYEYVTGEDLAAIEEWIEEYYPDVNENGKVEILATDCSFSLDTDQKSYVDEMMLKIQTLIANEKDAMLFILDEESLKYLNGISKEVVFFTNANIVKLPQSFYDALPADRSTLNETKPRYLCLRTVGGTAIESEKATEYYNGAKKVIEALK